MSPGGAPGAPLERDLEAELAAERASVDEWRRVARQRSAEYSGLAHRPVVRAALAVERRFLPVRRLIGGATRRLHAALDHLMLIVSALGRRGAPGAESAAEHIRRLPPAVVSNRRLTLAVVGATSGPEFPMSSGGLDVEPVVVSASRGAVDTVAKTLGSSDGELVGIMLATTEPLDDSALARLAAEVVGDVVAATPLLIHPTRQRTRATPHDGLVRTAGLSVALTAAGSPEVCSRRAGTVADATTPTVPVAAGSAACVLFERDAYVAAGGLGPGEDLDVAVVELCAYIRANGGQVVMVPAAAMIDQRPVRSRRDLDCPIDPAGRGWAAAIDRSGSLLARSARPAGDETLRFVFTVGAPSMKVAPRWGDWHLANGLAGALVRLGHEVSIQTADQADELGSRACDVRVVLRGLRPVRRSAGQRHVLWIISHPESIESEELDAADLVLVASARFAGYLRSRTSTPVEVFLQATDHHRFYPRAPGRAHQHPITVVAKTRDVLRPAVADALAAGLQPSIYGGGWRELVDPALVVADHLDNEQLPVVYSSAGVVLNDHWRTMQAWGFISNRLYDVLACGTPVISDPVDGVAELFDGAVLEYHNPGELRDLVEGVLADPATARLRAERGQEAVLARHTVDHRAVELLNTLARFVRTQ